MPYTDTCSWTSGENLVTLVGSNSGSHTGRRYYELELSSTATVSAVKMTGIGTINLDYTGYAEPANQWYPSKNRIYVCTAAVGTGSAATQTGCSECSGTREETIADTEWSQLCSNLDGRFVRVEWDAGGPNVHFCRIQVVASASSGSQSATSATSSSSNPCKTSRDACVARTAELGYKWDGDRNWADREPGCLESPGYGEVNWNTNTAGVKTTHTQIPLNCPTPGNLDVTTYHDGAIRTPDAETGVCGWRLVRFLPAGSHVWHPVSDDLAGTGANCNGQTTHATSGDGKIAYVSTPAGCSAYGDESDFTEPWSVNFGTYDEYVLGTCNHNTWVQIQKDALRGGESSYVNKNTLGSSTDTDIVTYRKRSTENYGPDVFF
jgi:hypothetical protein